MTGVPIAVIVEGAGGFENTVQLHTTRAHEIDIGAGAGVTVLEGPLFLGLAPEDLIGSVGVEGWINIDQIHALIGELVELIQIVSAVDDLGVNMRGGSMPDHEGDYGEFQEESPGSV